MNSTGDFVALAMAICFAVGFAAAMLYLFTLGHLAKSLQSNDRAIWKELERAAKLPDNARMTAFRLVVRRPSEPLPSLSANSLVLLRKSKRSLAAGSFLLAVTLVLGLLVSQI